MFPSCRKSSRTATRFTMFVRFLEIQKRSHFRTIALLFKFSFSKIIFSAIFPQSQPTAGRKPSPRRRSDRKIGNKAISPLQGRNRVVVRPDFVATKRGSKRQRAPPARINTGRKPSPRRRSDRKVGNKAISPHQGRNRVVVRPNFVATKRGSRCQRAPPARKRGDRVG